MTTTPAHSVTMDFPGRTDQAGVKRAEVYDFPLASLMGHYGEQYSGKEDSVKLKIHMVVERLSWLAVPIIIQQKKGGLAKLQG